MSESVDMPATSRPGWLKPLVAIVLIVALVIASRYFPVATWIKAILDYIDSLGFVGQLLFIGMYIVATVLFIPGLILTVGAGVMFGVVWGTVAVSIGSVIGATLAFLLGRYAMRGWVTQRIEGNEKFAAVDRAVADAGWKIVGLVRLSPLFPFNLTNYAFGVTNVSLRDYFFASWIGMLPGTIMYVYIGAITGDLAAFLSGERQKEPMEWVLFGFGLLMTIIVTVLVTRVARRALSNTVDENVEAEAS